MSRESQETECEGGLHRVLGCKSLICEWDGLCISDGAPHSPKVGRGCLGWSMNTPLKASASQEALCHPRGRAMGLFMVARKDMPCLPEVHSLWKRQSEK